LNKSYLGKDKPTNVLSFPQYNLHNGDFSSYLKAKNRFFLGDIAVSYQRVYTESNEQAKAFLVHFVHLVIHGFLHRCGFDHIDDKQAEEMENLEIKILKELGIENPYYI
jgi:probable rRNA maturation factor